MRCDQETIVEAAIRAWFLQDVDTTLAYCHDDVCYVIHGPPEAKFARQYCGKGEVRAYLNSVCDAWDFIFMEPTGVTNDGNMVREITRFRSRHKASGDILESVKRHVWIVEGGRIVRVDEFQDTPFMRAFLKLHEYQGFSDARDRGQLQQRT
jgi:ketosteroid isomerase-like protein